MHGKGTQYFWRCFQFVQKNWKILLDMISDLGKVNIMGPSQKQEYNITEVSHMESKYLKYDGVM